ncbi:hypothetical protein Desgi_4689 [Desulfoscipio gibsoniae DSM 7213]|uniref:DUF465 domain-containing protein n=2 Tax=Desulfoscipio gibsoniae TaxID=102134 RepID=R4KTI5_9FIRM|nr:hypothetical protein Desgi_4689 [Desulfoscipio gibsoniae DSM 7213]
MTTADHKFIVEQNKERIYRLKQQVDEATDPQEKRRLKRRLRQAQIEQIKYLNKLA